MIGEYGPAAVRTLRARALRARPVVSVTVFARLVGATPARVGHREQGRRTPAPIARRLLNRIAADPAGLLGAPVCRPNGGRTAPDTRTGSSSPHEVIPLLPVVRRSHL